MEKRYLGVLIMSPFIVFLFLGGIYLYIAALLISLLGMYEFYKVVRLKNIRTIDLAGYTLCVIYFILFYRSGFRLESSFILFIMSTMILLCLPVLNPEHNFIDIANTILAYVYIAIPFSFAAAIGFKPYGRLLVWLPFICCWACDSMALYAGKIFGKTKLCPLVSPKKTVEGSIGGFIASIAASGIFGFFINSGHLVMPIYNFLIIGALCGVFSQFGDLVASSVKRHVGTKDFSNLIPGHGGILDRFDSILFASVVVYYYITFIMVM